MTQDVGKGFARRVTKSNLGSFAPLLRDRTKDPNQQPSEESSPSGTSPGTISDELAAAQALFDGSRVQVQLPFPRSSGTVGQEPGTGPTHAQTGPSEGQDDEASHYGNSVLVAEISGPGRWKQASFSKEVFSDFFGVRSGGSAYTTRTSSSIDESASA